MRSDQLIKGTVILEHKQSRSVLTQLYIYIVLWFSVTCYGPHKECHQAHLYKNS
jgi:hypothetical protein